MGNNTRGKGPGGTWWRKSSEPAKQLKRLADNWANNPDLTRMAIAVQLHKAAIDRTINAEQTVSILADYIPALKKAQCFSKASVGLIAKCILAVGIPQGAPLTEPGFVDWCFSAIDELPNHQIDKDTFILPVIQYLQNNTVTPSKAARDLWGSVLVFCHPIKVIDYSLAKAL